MCYYYLLIFNGIIIYLSSFMAWERGFMKQNLTIEEIANIMRVERQTVWLWCRAGKLQAFKMGKRWLVDAESLAALQRKQRRLYNEFTR